MDRSVCPDGNNSTRDVTAIRYVDTRVHVVRVRVDGFVCASAWRLRRACVGNDRKRYRVTERLNNEREKISFAWCDRQMDWNSCRVTIVRFAIKTRRPCPRGTHIFHCFHWLERLRVINCRYGCVEVVEVVF